VGKQRPHLGPPSGTGPGGGTLAHSPPLFISVVSILCRPTLPRVLVPPDSQPPAVYLTKSLVYFYLLDHPCTLPVLFRADSRAGAACLAWLPFPRAKAKAGLANSYLFCLLTS
jgi:hypothetical protein